MEGGSERQFGGSADAFHSYSTMVASSAAGVLALLSEPEHIFKQHALKALNPLVPRFWAEISEPIALMCVPQLVLSLAR